MNTLNRNMNRNIIRKLHILGLASALCLPLSLAGCGSGSTEAATPFSPLAWDSAPEELAQLEGEAKETYPSVYSGTTYVYDGVYQERNGSFKYMYDEDEKLMCIAWTYTAEDAADLDSAYTSVQNEVEAAEGESGYTPSGSTNYGGVWYREEGDIVLSAVTSGEQYAMQYAYLNPQVSNKEAPTGNK